ncbi:LAFE_0G18536g1_1 [Lachancea fermentati]|uniref:LAFE_0G18536g1_1 n=1 Tax=Lachancea fermentati TaxID=4955 RepID=A0A1G4MJ35_LACFM|nr:LAFE_0G18536g1_1 [Lachancea fermentati]
MSVEEVTQKTEDLNINESTVLSDKDFQLKHPLNTKWTLWYTKPPVDKSESWSDLLRPVTSFKTVEEFWAIHNAIPKPRYLPFKSDYHLFREDIRPEWEDPTNAQGGKWTYQFKGKTPEIDDLWMRSLLAVIGETIDEDDSEINGVVTNVRKNGYKIAIWTKSADNKEALTRIGSKFKTVLKLGEEAQLEFFPHSTASEKHPQPSLVL